MPRPAIHPGEILADELAELGVTPTELSRQINVPPNRVTQIIHGRRGITGDTALRLGHWFGTSAQFWLNLQSAYDIRVAERKGRAGNRAASDSADRSRCGSAEAADAALSDRAGDTERARLTLPFSARARQAGPHQPEDQACRGDPLCVVALGGILPFDLDHYLGWSSG